MSSLPLIDVEKYFNDPSIPDGPNVGFVNPQGVVHDRFGKAVGIDSKHENAKNPDILERLRALAEPRPVAPLNTIGKPERRIRKEWRLDGWVFALDQFDCLWVLRPTSMAWEKARINEPLPPLPQEA